MMANQRGDVGFHLAVRRRGGTAFIAAGVLRPDARYGPEARGAG